MLSFMVSPSAADANASSASPWRTSVASVVIGSNQLVTVDDTGIWFHGRRWLAAIANAIDITRKKGESPLTLIARADTGRFSLDRLPERVRNALREGLRITITEDVHRLAIPVDALVQMANAPAGVRSRFANLDFTIEGDELNALQDFASRVGPKEGGIGSVAQTAVEQPGTTQAAVTPPVAAQDSARALGLIPAGSEIELKSASRECSDSVTLGQQFTAILARPVGSIGIAHLDAGAPVLLMVSDLQGGPPQTDAVHVRISAVSITISGRQYPLHGTVVKGTALKEAQGANSCVPINGSLILRLSRAFQVPR
jgi:hypothetical protein